MHFGLFVTIGEGNSRMWSCSERGLEPPSRRRAPSERENNAPPTCADVLRRVRSTHLILVVWRSSALLGVPWRFHSLRRLLRATHGEDAAQPRVSMAPDYAPDALPKVENLSGRHGCCRGTATREHAGCPAADGGNGSDE